VRPRSAYQEKVDTAMEPTILRLAANFPDLIDSLVAVSPNQRRALTRSWIRNNTTYAELVIEGFAVFVGELEALARLTVPKNRIRGMA